MPKNPIKIIKTASKVAKKLSDPKKALYELSEALGMAPDILAEQLASTKAGRASKINPAKYLEEEVVLPPSAVDRKLDPTLNQAWWYGDYNRFYLGSKNPPKWKNDWVDWRGVPIDKRKLGGLINYIYSK